MNQIQQNVFEAQQEVERAKAKVKRQENAKLELKKVRSQLPGLERELQRLADESLQLKADLKTAENNLTAIRSRQIALDEKLVNDLPDGEDLAAWQQVKVVVDLVQAEWVEKKLAAKDRLAILQARVMEIEPQVNRLRFAEQQFKQLARGDDPDDSASWIGSEGPGIAASIG